MSHLRRRDSFPVSELSPGPPAKSPLPPTGVAEAAAGAAAGLASKTGTGKLETSGGVAIVASHVHGTEVFEQVPARRQHRVIFRLVSTSDCSAIFV